VPEEDFHLSDQTHFQAHWEPLSPAATSAPPYPQLPLGRQWTHERLPHFISSVVAPHRGVKNSSENDFHHLAVI